MKKTIIAVAVACAAALSFRQPVSADSLTIKVKPRNTVVKVKPRVPVVKKVIVRKPCYYKTVKTYKANKTVIKKQRVCP